MKEKYIYSFLIGLCVGVIVYSLYKGTFGLFMLLPLVFIYLGKTLMLLKPELKQKKLSITMSLT